MAGVLGMITPDPISEALGADFQRFASPCGVFGLAQERGDSLHVLAVIAEKPGTGQFRAFVDESKRHYKRVYFWEVLNPVASDALERYGFTFVREIGLNGELNKGWKWEAE